ncbi:MAG: AAA family ATPase [Desulfurivibrionaceae bacterium]
MANGIGLCGSHRTGKTTLAAKIAEKSKLPFIKTATSQVFARNGLDPAERLDFASRIRIQHEILREAEKDWDKAEHAFVTDRTPIDMMAYTMVDIVGTSKVEFSELQRYFDRCYSITNRFFSCLFFLEPGIPIIYEKGKAALNRSYIEHLNVLMKGFILDDRLERPVRMIPKEILALEERAAWVDESLKKLRIIDCQL